MHVSVFENHRAEDVDEVFSYFFLVNTHFFYLFRFTYLWTINVLHNDNPVSAVLLINFRDINMRVIFEELSGFLSMSHLAFKIKLFDKSTCPSIEQFQEINFFVIPFNHQVVTKICNFPQN
jgi:hypothetical protein